MLQRTLPYCALTSPMSFLRHSIRLLKPQSTDHISRDLHRSAASCHCAATAASASQFPLPGNEDRLTEGLYVVATPIGCLEDITLRALRVLRSADKILCEDTRRTSLLLRHYGIDTPMESYHMYNEFEKISKVLRAVESGGAYALCSDAGMPAINDPGYLLISSAAEQGLPVVPVPGPSATLAALVASGLPTNSFHFCGFADAKKTSRRKQFAKVVELESTLLFFVSPHALLGMLADACEVLGGERRCCLARELTKAHEELWRSTLAQALEEFTHRGPRGEFTVVIEGKIAEPSNEVHEQEIMQALREAVNVNSLSPSQAAKEVAAALKVPKKRVYALSLQLSDHDGR